MKNDSNYKTNENKKLFLVLGDQLFYQNKNLKECDFLMIESRNICDRFNYHKQKLTFILGGMRNYRDFLSQNGFFVNYFDLEVKMDFTQAFLDLSSKYLEISFFEIADKKFSAFINDLAKKYFKKITILENPQFLTTKQEFTSYLLEKSQKRLQMGDFYIWQRKRFNLLLGKDGKPLGGKWTFDEENRKKLPKNLQIPILFKPNPNSNYLSAQLTVNKYFPNNPGINSELWLPTSFEEANCALDSFFENKLFLFGDYEDALSIGDPFLFHSVLSPIINNGLLTPVFVLDKLAEVLVKNPILLEKHLNSIEGFIRQIIGWREWIKGMYDNKYGQDLEEYNFFNAKNPLPSYFYFQNNTELKENETVNIPLKFALENLQKYGYNHHIERLMVIGNWMVLNEYDPIKCYNWFMEMYVDAYDWVMVPNVIGMALFADGGIFATKPYISGGNYLKKMANYSINLECEKLWTDKFWNFLMKNKSFFKTNPRMAMLISTREKKESGL